jgi:hypothetical protein
MTDEKRNEEEKLSGRFPDLPPTPEAPEVPKLSPKLPPHPAQTRPGQIEPGSYNKMAIASQAASALVMPVIVLSLAGWWLDTKLHHSTGWLAFIGVIVGFIAGVSALLKIVSRLSD